MNSSTKRLNLYLGTTAGLRLDLPELNLQQVHFLLLVALEPPSGGSFEDIVKLLGCERSTISRLTDLFGKRGDRRKTANGKPAVGFGLVEDYRDPKNNRISHIRLTAKGDNLMARLAEKSAALQQRINKAA